LLIPTCTLRALQDIATSGGNALTSVNLSIASPGIRRQPRPAGRPFRCHALAGVRWDREGRPAAAGCPLADSPSPVLLVEELQFYHPPVG
jgi:hypothetical protein